jgi:predicted phage terminase large subunit-like protein
MQHEKDKLSWQGSGIPLIGFDELTHFSEGQFFYLLSRNRLSNNCGIRPYIRATCNPDPDSWVARFIEWWIDQDSGLPIKERAGVPRYFIRENGKIIWGDNPKAFNLAPGQEAKSVTFIPALVTDNKALLKNDPAYLSNLHALPMVERERLLNGNWKVRPVSGSFFKRHWFKVIKASECPTKGRMVRYWDRAATEVSTGSKDPDWTAGVCGILPDEPIQGERPIIITDVKRQRLSPAGVMAIIKRSIEEATECEQWLEEDPGQAGKSEVEMYRRELPDQNMRTLRPKGSKAFRARPASAAAENGKIWLVEGPWNDAFIQECESFADWDVIEKAERPSKLPHDDQVDALSGLVYVLHRGGAPSITRA